MFRPPSLSGRQAKARHQLDYSPHIAIQALQHRAGQRPKVGWTSHTLLLAKPRRPAEAYHAEASATAAHADEQDRRAAQGFGNTTLPGSPWRHGRRVREDHSPAPRSPLQQRRWRRPSSVIYRRHGTAGGYLGGQLMQGYRRPYFVSHHAQERYDFVHALAPIETMSSAP